MAVTGSRSVPAVGVALAPTLALEGIRDGVSVLPLPPASVRRILPVRMSDHALTPAAGTFAGFLRDSAAASPRGVRPGPGPVGEGRRG